MLLLKQCYC